MSQQQQQDSPPRRSSATPSSICSREGSSSPCPSWIRRRRGLARRRLRLRRPSPSASSACAPRGRPLVAGRLSALSASGARSARPSRLLPPPVVHPSSRLLLQQQHVFPWIRPLPCSASSVRPRASCGQPSVHQSICCPPCSSRWSSWLSCSAGRGGFARVEEQLLASICCSHKHLPSGDFFLCSSLFLLHSVHILSCSFMLLQESKPHLGENRGSDYMSTCACSWLIIICHCFVVMWPLISVAALVQASCFLLVDLPLVVVRLQYAPISCLGCAVIFK